MNAEREQIDTKCDVSLRIMLSVDSIEAPEAELEPAFIRVSPWQECTFTVPIAVCEHL